MAESTVFESSWLIVHSS